LDLHMANTLESVGLEIMYQVLPSDLKSSWISS
jgi:hypothetical protein